MENQSPKQIAQHYKAMLDSVNLINGGKPGFMSDTEWTDCLSRNVEHLELMVAKDFWTTEDMAPINAAIAFGNTYLQSQAA
jgi:hypothetical protein